MNLRWNKDDMSEYVNLELNIFGTGITLSTDKPDEMKLLANELEKELINLSSMYPGIKQNIILTMTCLKLLGINKKLTKENTELVEEHEKLNKTMQGFYV